MNNWNQLTKAFPSINFAAWFIRNPKNNKTLVFSLSSGLLWEYENETFTLLHKNLKIKCVYLNAATCYWDPNTDCLTVALIKGYGSESVLLYRLENGVFQEIELQNGDSATSYDCLVWDNFLNQLVHIRNLDESPRTGIDARILQGETWIQTDFYGPFSARISLTAGYDEHRKMLVAIDSDGRCAGLSGTNWVPLPNHPTGAWKPAHFVASPTSGRLTMMNTERDTSPKTIMYELGETKWNKIETGEIVPQSGNVDFNHGLHFPENGYSLFLGCRPDHNRPNFLFTKFDGEKITPFGPIIPPKSNLLSVHGKIIAHEQFSYKADKPIAIAEFVQDEWREVPPVEMEIIKVCIDAENTLVLQPTGSVHSLQNKSWTKINQGNDEFIPCVQAAVVWDSEEKCMYVTGGEPLAGGKYLTDLFKFSISEGWKKLDAKGKKPAFCNSVIGWDGKRKVLVLTGGVLKSWKSNELVFEWDGKTWKNFPSEDYYTKYISSLNYDPKVGKLIVCGLGNIAIYHGAGNFEIIYKLDQGGIISYDVYTQMIYCLGDSLESIYIGDLLRDLPEFKPQLITVETRKEVVLEEFKPNRYLRFSEDESDKFWIAELTETSYELHWGKRGTKGQKKTYTCDSEEKARKEFNKKVQEKLNKGYWEAPEGKDASILPGKTAYHWVFDGKGTDFVGGELPQKETPICTCGEKMMHILTTDTLHVLQANHSISAYICPSPDGTCETWEAFSGANQVIFNTENSKTLQKEWLKESKHGVQVSPNVLSYTEIFEPDPTSEDADDLEIEDKCSGHPTWYQGEQTPTCPTCEQEMSFVAQFSEFDSELNFGGDGVAYLFVCKEEHEGALLWQCG